MNKAVCMVLIAGVVGFAGPALAVAFAAFDSNGDGVITQDEFLAAYPDMDKSIWAAVDVNGDGQRSEDRHKDAIESGTLPAE